jgi:4-amino-4-deoxy-L-arabinose transferase-like glycosyltransferase
MFCLVVAAFAISIVIVNPLRETPIDDDFTYSLMVKHLLTTGHYQMHDFAAPNMPFQVYWGALFAMIRGYSFSALRVSTIVFALFGLVTFYGLARHHELDPDVAGVATLAFLASPLYFQLAYTFNTDAPFLACWVAALLAYSVALARGRTSLMLLGGLAGAAAILIRQFGVALIPALVGTWLLDRQRNSRLPLYSVGIVPLLGPAGWQIWAAMSHPNWVSRVVHKAQTAYFAQPEQVALELLWRPSAALHYLALFSLALLLVVPACLWASWRSRQVVRLGNMAENRAVLLPIAAYLASMIVLGTVALGEPLLMPYLPWYLSPIVHSRWASAALTIVSFLGAVYLGWTLYHRYFGWSRPTAPQHWLLDVATSVLLAQHLIFYKMGDRYLLDLLPLALIVLTRHLRGSIGVRLPLAIASGLGVLAVAIIGTRGFLAYQEARWEAAETGRASGISPADIYGPWTWNLYYRFPDYLTDIDHRVPDDLSKSLFDEWLPAQEQRAQYQVLVSRTPPPPGLWQVKRDVPFLDMAFRQSHAYLVRRLPASGRAAGP